MILNERYSVSHGYTVLLVLVEKEQFNLLVPAENVFRTNFDQKSDMVSIWHLTIVSGIQASIN